jgi:hypothetical protein
MRDLVRLIIWMVVDLFRSRAALEAEILTLRQQINVLRRTTPKKQTFRAIDRSIFVGLYRLRPGVRDALAIVKPGWRTFLRNHAPDIAAMVVPTIGFRMLYSFVIVRLDRRDLVWINVTTNPTAEWIARQLAEAFPWDMAPHLMIRDRDRIYGIVVTRRLRAMGIRDKPTAPASPWQDGFAERLIGSIRHECLDRVIVLGEAHLRRILKSYADCYNAVS